MELSEELLKTERELVLNELKKMFPLHNLPDSEETVSRLLSITVLETNEVDVYYDFTKNTQIHLMSYIRVFDLEPVGDPIGEYLPDIHSTLPWKIRYKYLNNNLPNA